eukprot:COSAG06_NODE_34372_length_475_cov_1.369681_1_plen_63_part_01
MDADSALPVIFFAGADRGRSSREARDPTDSYRSLSLADSRSAAQQHRRSSARRRRSKWRSRSR